MQPDAECRGIVLPPPQNGPDRPAILPVERDGITVTGMGPTYDFDIHPVIPAELVAKMRALGVKGPDSPRRVALFRDPRAVAALMAADQEVRDIFLAAGFGFDVRETGRAPDEFPAAQTEARVAVMRRLGEVLEARREVIGGSDWGGFDLSGLVEHVAQARPVGADGPEDEDTAAETVPGWIAGSALWRGMPLRMTKVLFWALFGLTLGQYGGFVF